MLISLTCKGPSKQRYTIQSYPVNWHFHSIIPHPKNKTYIRKPWSPATPSVGWFVEAQGSWYKSQRCYLGGDRMSWLSPGWMFHIQTKQHDTQTQCSFETWFCVWSTKGKFFSSRTSNRTSPHFPTDFFRYHSFFPSFHLILCTRLILCTLEETNAPVFYKDCLTPTAPFLIKKEKLNQFLVWGASWFVIACFPFCSSEISMMTSFGCFYCFAWQPKLLQPYPTQRKSNANKQPGGIQFFRMEPASPAG